jgi:ABC-type polysaccharide transport system permease subunit
MTDLLPPPEVLFRFKFYLYFLLFRRYFWKRFGFIDCWKKIGFIEILKFVAGIEENRVKSAELEV